MFVVPLRMSFVFIIATPLSSLTDRPFKQGRHEGILCRCIELAATYTGGIICWQMTPHTGMDNLFIAHSTEHIRKLKTIRPSSCRHSLSVE